MIGLLGMKRVVLLGAFLALNGVLATVSFLYIFPFGEKSKSDLEALRVALSAVRADVSRMKVEAVELESQKVLYQTLEKDAFFKDQSRRTAEQAFSDIQTKSGVGKATAQVDAGVIEDNPEAQKVKYKILKSPMKISLEAVDDVDVFRYLYLIEQTFPGHVSVEKIEMKRQGDVNFSVVRALSSGLTPTLVTANIEMLWRTMIPESKVIGGVPPDGTQNAEGTQ